jgi:hypothetical protein
MIKDGLTIKAFHKGKEIKVIELKHLPYFFKGLDTLANRWKVDPFTKLWGVDHMDDTIHHSLSVMIYLIYKVHFGKGWNVNIKRFKNELLYRTRHPKVFLMESDYLNLNRSQIDSALSYLKQIGFIHTDSYNRTLNINNSILKYCIRLGDYLFNSYYCQKSFERNTHYFGDSNSFEHSKAYEERKEITKRSLH